MEPGTFSKLIPSRYISFTLPLSSIPSQSPYFHTNSIQISLLDSPLHQPNHPPTVAAMLVPKFRENDSIFATESGHLQLLHSCNNISRLILIGNAQTDDDNIIGTLYKKSFEINPFCKEELERSLYPLIRVLIPNGVDQIGNFDVPFLSYEDNLISSVILDKCIGDYVGEMLVEDVEIEGVSRAFRRRLRFKRMPNLIQTEISVIPSKFHEDGSVFEFSPNLGLLVHPYLPPMVASFGLISGFIHERLNSGVKPRGLCLGVGGGALLSFLSKELGFDIVGVEIDEMVLNVAKRYFGLEIGERIQVCIGDGIEMLKTKNVDVLESKFDAIMVDLDSSEAKMGISAPTMEFLDKDVLLAVKSGLSDCGIVVVNVIPLDQAFFDLVIRELEGVFVDLYQIDVGNGENFVVIGSKTSVKLDSGGLEENGFLRKLKSVVSEVFIDAIKKI